MPEAAAVWPVFPDNTLHEQVHQAAGDTEGERTLERSVASIPAGDEHRSSEAGPEGAGTSDSRQTAESGIDEGGARPGVGAAADVSVSVAKAAREYLQFATFRTNHDEGDLFFLRTGGDLSGAVRSGRSDGLKIRCCARRG